MIGKYRTRQGSFPGDPLVVEALQYTGENKEECFDFMGFIRLDDKGNIHISNSKWSFIVSPGDWIVKCEGMINSFWNSTFSSMFEEISMSNDRVLELIDLMEDIASGEIYEKMNIDKGEVNAIEEMDRIMNMSDEEIREELIKEGKDVSTEAEKIREIIRSAMRRAFPQKLLCKKIPLVGRRYKHLKTDTWYRVLCVGKMEKDQKDVVVYHKDNPSGFRAYEQIWIRPLSEFMDGRFELEKIEG